MFTRIICSVAICALLFPAWLRGQGYSVIVLGDLQIASSLSASVQDPSAAPMEGVLVEEFDSDWTVPLRSTTTDGKGKFAFASNQGRRVHYFQLTAKNFDLLRFRLKVNSKHGKELHLRMDLGA
jgi:hypothetical protein